MSMKTGLALGKFAPLHRGHQFVIETALAEVNELIILIYDCPEVTSVPLPVRANWLRKLYPSAQVIESWDGPTQVGDTPEIKRMHEEYTLGLLGSRRITHFYSSEFYGEHMSAALQAVNREVDRGRQAIPVSGTMIRANPFAFRDFLHPLVYRDLVTNVVLLGAPSTGKTTLTEQLAHEFETVWMPEYGREYWAIHQSERRLTLEQLVEIAEGHLEREEIAIQSANRFLFTDTNALTTRHFSLYYHNAVAPQLDVLADRCATRYDLVLVCDTDIPYDNTWDRSGETNRQVFQKQILSDLSVRKIPFFMLRGDVASRSAQVKTILERHPKYSNPLEPYSASWLT